MSDIKKEPATGATVTDLAQIVTTGIITEEQQEVNTIAMLDELVNEYDRIQKQYIDYVNFCYEKAIRPYKVDLVANTIHERKCIQYFNFDDFHKAVMATQSTMESEKHDDYMHYSFMYKDYEVVCLVRDGVMK